MSSAPSTSTEPTTKRTYRIMAGGAVVMIVLISIAIHNLSQVQPQTWTSSLKEPSVQATLRQDLPHFEYSNEGKALSSLNFTGHWTLITFWAYWCGPCLEEMPALNQLSQQWHGPAFEILTINVDDPESESFAIAKEFLSEQGVVIPTLFDKNGVLKKAFEVENLPQHFLVNPEAKIVWKATGAFQWNEPNTRDQLMALMELEASKSDEATDVEVPPREEPAPGPAVESEVSP